VLPTPSSRERLTPGHAPVVAPRAGSRRPPARCDRGTLDLARILCCRRAVRPNGLSFASAIASSSESTAATASAHEQLVREERARGLTTVGSNVEAWPRISIGQVFPHEDGLRVLRRPAGALHRARSIRGNQFSRFKGSPM